MIEPHTQLDQTVLRARVRLVSAPTILLTGIDLTQLQACESILRACEMSGACTHIVEMTSEYVKTREQFDVPIGGFQAIQQKLAQMYMEAESLRALSFFAAWAKDYSPGQLELAAISALRYASNTAPNLVETAIQLHGGIGFTWEHDLHLYLRRVRALCGVYKATSDDLDQFFLLAQGALRQG